MKTLVASSNKRLAPVSGKARFRTFSCSHMSQCVAWELPELHGRATANDLGLGGHHNQVQWWVFQPDAERWVDLEDYPAPGWSCMPMATTASPKWIEHRHKHCSVAHWSGADDVHVKQVRKGKKLHDYLDAMKATSTLSYLEDIASFISFFCFLHDQIPGGCAKAEGLIFDLGWKFTYAISKDDFKNKACTFLMFGVCLICSNLSSGGRVLVAKRRTSSFTVL